MKIVLVGASGHAGVVLDAARAAGDHDVVGMIDRDLAVGSEWLGCKVLGRDDALRDVMRAHAVEGALVAVGDNFTRTAIARRLRGEIPSLAWVTVVHPAATLATGARLGAGSVVMAGAVVNPGCEVGAHAIVNTGACLDHDSKVGDGASLAPGVVTGGGVAIGEGAAIGIGATLVHGVQVGRHTVVGAGALVLDDLPDHVVAYGTPARVVRARTADEPYLERGQ